MKKILALFVLAFTLTAHADDYKHIVTVGSNGFGWSGASEKMETNSRSVFADVDYFLSNIGLNYGYRLNKRIVLGGFFLNHQNEYKFNTPNSSASVKKNTTIVGLYTLYNFSDTLPSAWYAGFSASHFNIAEETSHNAAIAEGKNPFELDDAGEMYEIFVGKRFPLTKWNIEHLTYAPQIGIYTRTHGRDLDDQDVKKGYGYTFQPVRFDFLF